MRKSIKIPNNVDELLENPIESLFADIGEQEEEEQESNTIITEAKPNEIAIVPLMNGYTIIVEHFSTYVAIEDNVLLNMIYKFLTNKELPNDILTKLPRNTNIIDTVITPTNFKFEKLIIRTVVNGFVVSLTDSGDSVYSYAAYNILQLFDLLYFFIKYKDKIQE